jgi:Glyoxalase-like domain
LFLRLRQLCLVARELRPVVDELCAVLGLEVCHRDPEVARFGLHNALMRVGTSFIEVVAPLRGGTAAGRYLQRRGGDGGYMVILDCGDIEPWRRHVAMVGVRIAAELEMADYVGLQLHPQDTGGALLEINHTEGGDDLHGPYWPAGPHGQRASQSSRTLAIGAATLQSAEPSRLAARWSNILQRPFAANARAFEIALDNATRLRFVAAGDERGEGLSAIDLQVTDVAEVVASARRRGCEAAECDGSAQGTLSIGGVRWQLSTGRLLPMAEPSHRRG